MLVDRDIILLANWETFPTADNRRVLITLVEESEGSQTRTFAFGDRYGRIVTEKYISDWWQAHFKDPPDDNHVEEWYSSQDGNEKVKFPFVLSSDVVIYRHLKAVEEPEPQDDS